MDPSKVGGNSKPEEISKTEGPESGTGDISSIMQSKVSTVGELKSLLIKHLGLEQGTKFYNQFLTSFGLLMLQQVQQSAQQAKKAAQGMRNQ